MRWPGWLLRCKRMKDRPALDEAQRKVDEAVSQSREGTSELWQQMHRLDSVLKRANRVR